MKTMKSLIVSLALFIGFVGVSHAGRSGGGWSAYTVSASSAQVVSGPGFFNSMFLSTACTAGDFVVAFDTVAISTSTGLGFGPDVYNALITATSTVMTPQLIFGTTTTAVSGIFPPGNSFWSPGAAVDDYVEFSKGLFIYKNAVGTGGCDKATVYYSK